MIEDADAANAYLHFVHALCEMACNLLRTGKRSGERKICIPVFSSPTWLHRRRVQSGAEDFA